MVTSTERVGIWPKNQSKRATRQITSENKDSFEASAPRELGLIPRSLAKVQNDLQGSLDASRKRWGLPSQAVAVVDGENTKLAASGMLHNKSDVAVGTDAKYHLGSCTKMMTSTMLARLVKKGHLRWTSTVAEAFPKLAPKMHPEMPNIDLQLLTSHRAGVPSNFDMSDPEFLRRMFGDEVPREGGLDAGLRLAVLSGRGHDVIGSQTCFHQS